MRKPLVVLCAAAAVLAGGGFAANALAQESPDGTETPDFWIFEEPMADDLLGPFPDTDGWAGEPVPDPPAEAPPVRQSPSPADSSPAQSPSASPTSASPSPSRPATTPPHTRQPERPRPHADDRERPLRQLPGFARPQADPFAGARTAVSARSISSSPYAPVQQQVLALVNRNRRNHGCGPLTVDRRLIEAANRHAADMARRGYFAHEGPRGDRAGHRVAEAGYEWQRYGENIARGQETPYEVVVDWMNSPEHRENILDCRLDEVGVGLAIARDDTPYWVQDFATPR
ncbi:CAP domain-containing protein [Actinoplanes sp. NPDC024001]|uniref:CAP domain-containing protein n=1 Tax=Actinoplanes sp. NPDC024001 TaxID=3154598 RepID=UPI0033EA7F24